jgi:hypothetical protein
LGRPLLVLSGIDTGPTDDTSLCRWTVYSYSAVEGTDDDGTLESSSIQPKGSLRDSLPRAGFVDPARHV